MMKNYADELHKVTRLERAIEKKLAEKRDFKSVVFTKKPKV